MIQSFPVLEDLLCFALYGAHQAMGAAYKPLLDPLDITYPQYLVLVALWEENGQTVGRIGAKLGLASNTLTPILKRMEAAGLLIRSRSTADERQVRLSLTEGGRALQARAVTIPECVMKAAGMDMKSLDDLQQQIRNLRDRLAQSRVN
jgi:MarR family transcriptional regulator, organic hydroperoxide resistance regulator